MLIPMLLASCALGQHVDNTARASTRLSQGKLGTVTVEYGRPTWNENMNKLIDSGGRWQLGTGPWTSLDTDTDIVLGKWGYRRVPPGRYCMVLEPGKDRLWLLDPDRLRRARHRPERADETMGGLQLRVDHETLDEKEGKLTIHWLPTAGAESKGVLEIRFGPHRWVCPYELQLTKPQSTLPDIGTAIPAADQRILEIADFTVFALHPYDERENETKGRFHGFKILGQTKLPSSQRGKLLRLIFSGIQQSNGSVAECFEPRHGVRAVAGTETVDLVICYACLSIQVYRNGKRRPDSALTAHSVEPAVTAMFQALGLKIQKGKR